jgi:LppP/LprE lipoprotein
LQRIALSAIALVLSASAGSQPGARLWLDSASLGSWNSPGLSLPSAPQGQKNPDPRCRELVRSPASAEGRELRSQGWDLIGTPTESGQVQVIAGAADYDGMCRPRQYQFFVFSRGAFVGTLSPHLMDSRTDGSLNRVTIEGDRKLKAYYARYAQTDPLCCPSRTTTVLFSIGHDPAVLRPLTATTASNLSSSAPR